MTRHTFCHQNPNIFSVILAFRYHKCIPINNNITNAYRYVTGNKTLLPHFNINDITRITDISNTGSGPYCVPVGGKWLSVNDSAVVGLPVAAADPGCLVFLHGPHSIAACKGGLPSYGLSRARRLAGGGTWESARARKWLCVPLFWRT